MPRAFSVQEKVRIREALIDAAASDIPRVGFRKLSIDSLVHQVRISKGAFYLFYASKEMLIFDLLRHVQESARRDTVALMSAKKGGRGDDIPRRLLRGLFEIFRKYPVLAELSKPDSLLELLRGLPPEVLDEEFESDETFFRSLFKRAVKRKLIRDIDIGVLCGIPRMVLALELNREMIGRDRYETLKTLFISGMARELTRGRGRGKHSS